MSDSTAPLFVHARRVAFQDIDAAGIVFYARVFEYFHDAYVAFLATRGVDFAQVLASGAWGAPLVHAEADYQAPMRFGDALRVAIASIGLGETSVTVHYEVRSDDADGARRCSGKTVHVFIDRVTFRPRTVPPEILAAFKPSGPTGSTKA